MEPNELDEEFHGNDPWPGDEESSLKMRGQGTARANAARKNADEERAFKKKKMIVLSAASALLIVVLGGVAWFVISRASEPTMALGLPRTMPTPNTPSQLPPFATAPQGGGSANQIHGPEVQGPQAALSPAERPILASAQPPRNVQPEVEVFQPAAAPTEKKALPDGVVLERLDSLHTELTSLRENLDGFCGAPASNKKDPAITKVLQTMTDELQAAARENQELKASRDNVKGIREENDKLKKTQEDLQAALRSTEKQVDRLTQENSRLKGRSDKDSSDKGNKEPKEKDNKKDKKEGKSQDAQADSRIGKWVVVGLAANRVVIQDEDGEMHAIEAGNTLKGVKIQNVDLVSGDVKTSAGTLSYLKK